MDTLKGFWWATCLNSPDPRDALAEFPRRAGGGLDVALESSEPEAARLSSDSAAR